MPPHSENTARSAGVAPSRSHHIHKRQGPTDQVFPYPPPVYTPSIPLHASTVPYTNLPYPTSSVPGNSGPVPGAIPQALHGANVGLLVGAVLACSALLLLAGVLGWYMFRRKTSKLRSSHPRFSMFLPNPKTTAVPQKADLVWGNTRPQSATDDGGQFVFISTSEEDVTKNEKDDLAETPPLAVLQRIGSAFVSDANMRRHSSPAILEDFDAHQWLNTRPSDPPRPLSLPPFPRDHQLYIQRQRATELAQIMRMRIISDEPTRNDSDAQSFRNSLLSAHRRSMTHGLGIVHEVDEVASPRSAPDEYRRSAYSPPAMDHSELFAVDSSGQIVHLSVVSTDSPGSPASPGMPPTPLSLLDDEDNASVHSDDSSMEDHDLKGAVVVHAGRARSMEYKRPILVSVHTTSSVFTSPPASRSAPLLGLPAVHANAKDAEADTHASNSASTISAFPSPPPMLGPILTSPTAFAEDVGQSIQERMFGYRDAGPYSGAETRLSSFGPIVY